MKLFLRKTCKKFWWFGKKHYLCIAFENNAWQLGLTSPDWKDG